jgi:hypothetical protein
MIYRITGGLVYCMHFQTAVESLKRVTNRIFRIRNNFIEASENLTVIF